MSARCSECAAETFTCAACGAMQDLDAQAETDRSIITSLEARLDAIVDLADGLGGSLLIQEALNGYVHTAAREPGPK